MDTPLISIIIPVYKAEAYLNKCISSILNQSYSSFELILVNDGSPDNCGEICDNFAKMDKRIKVIHKKNEGVSCARNIGIDESKGKYIMFSDSDDYVESNWCEALLEVIEKNNQSLVMSAYNIQNNRTDKATISKREYGNKEEYQLEKKDFYILYEKILLNALWNKIYNLRIIKKNNIRFKSDISLGEDLLFNLEYLKHCEDKIVIVNKYLYNYILRDRESLDNKYYKNLFEIYSILYSELENCINLFNANNSEIRKSYSNSFLEMLHKALDNTFHKDSKLSFIQKIKYNNMIIKSEEFKMSFNNASLVGFDRKYITVLKFENYFWIYLLKKIAIYRGNILKNK